MVSSGEYHVGAVIHIQSSISLDNHAITEIGCSAAMTILSQFFGGVKQLEVSLIGRTLMLSAYCSGKKKDIATDPLDQLEMIIGQYLQSILQRQFGSVMIDTVSVTYSCVQA